MRTRFYILLFVAVAGFSCNKNEVIEALPEPVITLDSRTGVYQAKIDKPFTISPTVENNEGASYRWTTGGRVIGSGPALTYTADAAGALYITFRVTTPAGEDERELRVDVADLAPPVISFAVPDGGLKVLAGEAYALQPEVLNGGEFVWSEGGETVATTESYDFQKADPGSYQITLEVTNEDGSDQVTVSVEVIDEFSLSVSFLSTAKTVFSGRDLYLRPVVSYADDPAFVWTLDGETAARTRDYVFNSSTPGTYALTCTVTDGPGRTASVALSVTVYGSEQAGIRSGGSKKHFDRVYEYLPAPGQFINESASGFSGQSTMAAAVAYAQGRLESNLANNGANYVSLGGFGGYIVVGFDHSVENKGGYDFSVTGNQTPTSSEPGVVWVMQDVNGNGLPDDEWYQLKGSEYASCVQDYAITYFRPAGAKMNVQWCDNQGRTGKLNYMPSHHIQDYYYPAWADQNSYTLYGTLLGVQSRFDTGKNLWVNAPYDWGYADNWGTDRLSNADNPDAAPNKVYFKISNAVYPDGTPANLRYIDFVKVQSAANTQAPIIGENSTEVLGFYDENP